MVPFYECDPSRTARLAEDRVADCGVALTRALWDGGTDEAALALLRRSLSDALAWLDEVESQL